MGIRHLCRLFPLLLPFPGCSPHCPSSITCKKLPATLKQLAWILLRELLGIGIRVRLNPPLAQRRADRYSNESTNISMAFPSTWVPVLFCGPACQSDSTIENLTRGIPAPGAPLGCHYIVIFFSDAQTRNALYAQRQALFYLGTRSLQVVQVMYNHSST